MAAGGSCPVAVGTRGTIASLVKMEIEYFHKLEHENSSTVATQISDMDFVRAPSRTGLGFFCITWGRKKHKGSGFRPSICSVTEVADSYQLNGIREFDYTILDEEIQRRNACNT